MKTHAVFDAMTGDQVTAAMDQSSALDACARLGGDEKGYAVKWVQSAPVTAASDKPEIASDGPGLFD